MKPFRHVILLFAWCVIALLLSSMSSAKIIRVSPDGADSNDGSSWAAAKKTIGGALSTAAAGDEIWVRHGVYVERITLKNGVSLYGGFRGTESDLSERPGFPRPSPDPYETVIDGNQSGSVVTSPGSASQAYRLDGFTIHNGNADKGGGVNCIGYDASLLTIANCIITGNTSTNVLEGGGGISDRTGADGNISADPQVEQVFLPK